jgi:hypothetical protein
MSRLIRLLLALLFLTLAGQDQGARPAAAQEAPPDPLKEFIPHEKLPVDSAVAFPVDI